jgi:tetratricopeptide (TPR) repeat protein
VAPQIEQAVIKNPRDLNARIALAEAYLNLARYKDAIKQYNQALKINKNAQAAIVGLGIAYMMLGKNDKALQYFEREIDNFAGKQWSELNPSLELAYYYAASLWFRKKNYDTAIAYLIKALELKPASADTYFLLGRVYFEKREYDEAIKRFEEALRYDPKFPDPYYGIGLAYEKKGNQEEAIKYYRRALRMKPDFEQAKAALQRLEE